MDEKREEYVGSWIVEFTQVGGIFQQYQHQRSSFDKNKETAIRRKEAFTTANEAAHKILIPAIPALDIHTTNELPSDLSPQAELAEILQSPLVKVERGSIKGIRSGARSAIIQTEEKTYRLKGCGNYVNQEGFRHGFPGFPLRPLEICGEVVGMELRGCSFEYLSNREFYYCKEIEEIVKKYDDDDVTSALEPILLGNSPLGQWLYDLSLLSPQERETAEGMGITCSIFETKGEKRMAAHLMYGMEQLIAKFGILSSSATQTELEELLKNRRNSAGNSTAEIETWKACCIGDHPFEPIQIVDSPLFYVTFEYFDQFDDLIASNYSESVTSSWRDSLSLLRSFFGSFDEKDSINMVAMLYWRLGREVGEFSRIMKENDLMWGYYFDHNPFEPHCNSHLNNFILLFPHSAKEGKERRFSAPVDFDMTFDRNTFFSPYTSSPDDELFDDWKQSEINEMERCIGGDFANNGIDTPQVSAKINDELVNEHIDPSIAHLISFALRDTMLSAFRSSYNKEEDKFAKRYKREWDDVLQAFITLSLIASHYRQS